MKEFALGIDIGGTNTVFALVSEDSVEHFNGSIKTRDFANPLDMANAIHREIKSHLSQNKLIGVGIGAPNGNIHTGCIEFAPNLIWKGVIPLRDVFESVFKAPTIVTNDANAAAIGEIKFGAASGYNDFLLVTLGTGLGSGFVSNGQLIYGHDGMAGELGHVTVEENGRLCGCGRKGCLETYASSTGFLKTAHELIYKNVKSSSLHQIDSAQLTGEHITEAGRKKDELALEIFDFTASYLARGLATAIAITSPAVIIFFGGLSNAHDLLLPPLQKHLEPRLLNIFQNKVKLIPSALLHRNAAVLGAAALVWNEQD